MNETESKKLIDAALNTLHEHSTCKKYSQVHLPWTSSTTSVCSTLSLEQPLISHEPGITRCAANGAVRNSSELSG